MEDEEWAGEELVYQLMEEKGYGAFGW